MRCISPLGLDNSKLPGKAKLFAFIFSTPRACVLKILLVQQCTFLDHFCRHLRVNSPLMKEFRSLCLHHHRNHLCPFTPQFWNFSRKILIFFSFHSFLFSHPPILCYWQIYNLTAPVSLGHQIRSPGRNSWPVRTLNSSQNVVIPSFIPLKFALPSQDPMDCPTHFVISPLWFSSFGHELRIWLMVLAFAPRLVSLCFHVIST